jgi:hypothetical protein
MLLCVILSVHAKLLRNQSCLLRMSHVRVTTSSTPQRRCLTTRSCTHGSQQKEAAHVKAKRTVSQGRCSVAKAEWLTGSSTSSTTTGMLLAGLLRPCGCPEGWPEGPSLPEALGQSSGGGRNFGKPKKGNVRAFRLERSRRWPETQHFRANVRTCLEVSSVA